MPAKELFTTTEAATMLGLSRPSLMNVAAGEIAPPHPVQAILEFQRARRVRREKAAEALAAFSNEIGLVD